MVTLVEVVTDVVVTVKLAVVLPATTVTLVGGKATVGLLLESETETSLDGAALKVTVPVDEFPPVTLVGLSATEETVTELEPDEHPGKLKEAIRVLQAEPSTG